MKKIFLSIFSLLIVTTGVFSQDIGTIFLTMPESIIPELETAGKEQLLSYPEDSTSVSVNRNEFGAVKRTAISPDYIEIQTSQVGSMQIKLLPLVNNTQIICVVKTVCAKICDSQIQFYTTSWMPIPQGDLFPQLNKDWFIKTNTNTDDQQFKNAYTALDMNPMKIRLSPDDTSLKVYYEIENYLSDDDYKEIEPYLIKEPKTFSWDKTSYK